jgi:CHAT domain-containing protein
MALRERGYTEEASPFFEQALAAAGETAQDTGVRHLLEASVLASQERFAEAIDRYRRYAAARDGPDGDVALASALGAEQQRRARRNGLEQDFAFLTRVRSWTEAQAAADACQALAGDQWWAEDERPWRVLSDLGEVQEGLGRLEPALDRYEQAMRVFEARRGQLANAGLRASLGGSRDLQWLALLGARCALRLADADPSRGGAAVARAFGIVERGKARALLDMMARSAAFTPGRPGDPPALRRWRELGARAEVAAQLLEQRRKVSADPQELDALERRLAGEQRALQALEGELSRAEPGWLGGVRATGEVASLDEVVAAVPPGAALLQWSFHGNDLLAWAITGDGMVARARQELDTRKLGRAVRELRAACEGRAPGWEAAAEALAATLLGPFAGVLAAHQRIVVVPYGIAHQLPVHVLSWEGRALGETHSVSVLPSASVLRYTTGSSGRPWRVLAVGDPARMAYRPPGGARAEPAPPLRGAGAEAALAAAAFPGGELLGGEAATEQAVRSRLTDFPVLHFATHGRLDPDAPGLSCLLLAGGQALSVYELAGMELDVDLAVLSACRTGQGEATRGDDVVGLARGLLGAGCRATVVSLWPVDDASTAIVMAAFYRRLAAGSAPVDALRAAQSHVRGLGVGGAAAELATLRAAVPAGTRDVFNRLGPVGAAGYDHPHHWAPFVLVGTGAVAAS